VALALVDGVGPGDPAGRELEELLLAGLLDGVGDSEQPEGAVDVALARHGFVDVALDEVLEVVGCLVECVPLTLEVDDGEVPGPEALLEERDRDLPALALLGDVLDDAAQVAVMWSST